MYELIETYDIYEGGTIDCKLFDFFDSETGVVIATVDTCRKRAVYVDTEEVTQELLNFIEEMFGTPIAGCVMLWDGEFGF